MCPVLKNIAAVLLPIQIPDKEIITSMYTVLLTIKKLAVKSRRYQLWPHLNNKFLLFIGTFFDYGCIAIFDNAQVKNWTKINKHYGTHRTNTYSLYGWYQFQRYQHHTHDGSYSKYSWYSLCWKWLQLQFQNGYMPISPPIILVPIGYTQKGGLHARVPFNILTTIRPNTE